MPDRRAFLSSLIGAGLTLPTLRSRAFLELGRAEQIAAGRAAASLSEEEEYWHQIQRAFDLDRTMINLNNGGISPAPTHVLDQMIRAKHPERANPQSRNPNSVQSGGGT
jgi:isopenicillin-N epimerase